MKALRGLWLSGLGVLLVGVASCAFDPQPETLWKRIVQLKGWNYKLLADGPEDISWN